MLTTHTYEAHQWSTLMKHTDDTHQRGTPMTHTEEAHWQHTMMKHTDEVHWRCTLMNHTDETHWGLSEDERCYYMCAWTAHDQADTNNGSGGVPKPHPACLQCPHPACLQCPHPQIHVHSRCLIFLRIWTPDQNPAIGIRINNSGFPRPLHMCLSSGDIYMRSIYIYIYIYIYGMGIWDSWISGLTHAAPSHVMVCSAPRPPSWDPPDNWAGHPIGFWGGHISFALYSTKMCHFVTADIFSHEMQLNNSQRLQLLPQLLRFYREAHGQTLPPAPGEQNASSLTGLPWRWHCSGWWCAGLGCGVFRLVGWMVDCPLDAVLFLQGVGLWGAGLLGRDAVSNVIWNCYNPPAECRLVWFIWSGYIQLTSRACSPAPETGPLLHSEVFCIAEFTYLTNAAMWWNNKNLHLKCWPPPYLSSISRAAGGRVMDCNCFIH